MSKHINTRETRYDLLATNGSIETDGRRRVWIILPAWLFGLFLGAVVIGIFVLIFVR